MDIIIRLFEPLVCRLLSVILRIPVLTRWFPDRAPSLSCWLRDNPAVANSIKWQHTFDTSAYDIPESAKKAWPNWTDAEKQELISAFQDCWGWLRRQPAPLGNLNEPLQYPPVNLSETLATDTASPNVKVDQNYAREFYLRWVALQLVMEIGGHLPWSVRAYTTAQLQILFDSAAVMSRDPFGKYSLCSGNPAHPNYIKRKDNLGGALIAPPRYTYAFLATTQIIGTTRRATINNLLQWVSANLSHFIGQSNYLNMEGHWQYRGLPPISRTIEGTTENVTHTFGHWTAGCHGTVGFLRNVLRAVNIPVEIVRVCGHGLVYFTTEGLYLDHGDDPYNLTFKATGLPASDLLIDEATYLARFGADMNNHEQNCSAIGQQVTVLANP